MPFNPYRLLGVPKSADAATIKSAYRNKSKLAHPDQGGSAEKFSALKEARDVLMDPERRAYYDSTGKVKPQDIDQGRGPILALLGNVLIRVVAMAAEQNINIKVEDMVKAIVDTIGEALKEIEKRKVAAAARAKLFEEVASRMEADEDNVLKVIAEAQVGHIANEVRTLETSRGLHEAALKLAKSHRFRRDIIKPTQQQIYMTYVQQQASGTGTWTGGGW